ncbi:MAG: Fic family protein [Saprospiraceae bacterium]|jgi:Fic family protein
MIISNDSIMKPPYDITSTILHQLIAISEKIGEVNANHLHKPSSELRKKNRVKTIRASLQIEGNQLSEEQITAILENKRVIGSKKDITEVLNAIEVYDKLPSYNPHAQKSFLAAHQVLMQNLIPDAGKYRKQAVGVVKGDEIAHIAPPAGNVPYLMKNLFDYLKNDEAPVLIKSCVFHYEALFIHPFVDGNGRMARLWQTLVLLKSYPVFEFLPFETIIKDRQEQYYEVLSVCDKTAKSTIFIEFILKAIDTALRELLTLQTPQLTTKDRVAYFLSIHKESSFSRKDYLLVFKNISSATASRDLRYAVDNGLVKRIGEKRLTRYEVLE